MNNLPLTESELMEPDRLVDALLDYLLAQDDVDELGPWAVEAVCDGLGLAAIVTNATNAPPASVVAFASALLALLDDPQAPVQRSNRRFRRKGPAGRSEP